MCRYSPPRYEIHLNDTKIAKNDGKTWASSRIKTLSRRHRRSQVKCLVRALFIVNVINSFLFYWNVGQNSPKVTWVITYKLNNQPANLHNCNKHIEYTDTHKGEEEKKAILLKLFEIQLCIFPISNWWEKVEQKTTRHW